MPSTLQPTLEPMSCPTASPLLDAPALLEALDKILPTEPMLCPAKPAPQLLDSIMEMFLMKGKVCIVTGAGSGIGREVARALAEAGAAVAVWYHPNDKNVDDGAELREKYNAHAESYRVDVSDWNRVEQTVEQVVADFGRLDVMVANAGIAIRGDGLNFDFDTWRRTFAVDVDGVYFCARAAGHVFQRQGFGNIITTGSMLGTIVNTPQGQLCYNSAKAAVIQMTKTIAVEWALFCRANCVLPGYVDTGICDDVSAFTQQRWWFNTPLVRPADPREMKGIYLYLASDASSFATGGNFVVDGGYSVP